MVSKLESKTKLKIFEKFYKKKINGRNWQDRTIAQNWGFEKIEKLKKLDSWKNRKYWEFEKNDKLEL